MGIKMKDGKSEEGVIIETGSYGVGEDWCWALFKVPGGYKAKRLEGKEPYHLGDTVKETLALDLKAAQVIQKTKKCRLHEKLDNLKEAVNWTVDGKLVIPHEEVKERYMIKITGADGKEKEVNCVPFIQYAHSIRALKAMDTAIWESLPDKQKDEQYTSKYIDKQYTKEQDEWCRKFIIDLSEKKIKFKIEWDIFGKLFDEARNAMGEDLDESVNGFLEKKALELSLEKKALELSKEKTKRKQQMAAAYGEKYQGEEVVTPEETIDILGDVAKRYFKGQFEKNVIPHLDAGKKIFSNVFPYEPQQGLEM